MSTLDFVITGLKAKPFQQAIDELTICDVGIREGAFPFFNPIGAEADAKGGFRSKKYASNGPSDTASGWQSQALKPLEVRDDYKPRRFYFPLRSIVELEQFFLKANGISPSILDVAIWWQRFDDLEDFFGGVPGAELLVKRFVQEFQLPKEEQFALFSHMGIAADALSFSSTAADPVDYLPDSDDRSAGGASSVGERITDLLKSDETGRVEFKSTLNWDLNSGEKSEAVLDSCLRAIAGFLNDAGGVVLVGVSDDRKLLGLKPDYELCKLGKRNADGLVLKLGDVVRSRMNPKPGSYYKAKVHVHRGKEILVIQIEPAGDVIHLGDKVFVRENNSTRELTGRDLTDWIQRRLTRR